jgi:hypothetical protein
MSTYNERSAQRRADADAKAYRPLTVDDLRRANEQHARAIYTAAGHSPGEADRLTASHMETLTDDVLVQSWQQAGRDLAAKQAAQAAQWAADQRQKAATAKVSRTHTAKLAAANKVAMTYQERAEAAERKTKGLEAQLDGLWKGQGRH